MKDYLDIQQKNEILIVQTIGKDKPSLSFIFKLEMFYEK